MEIHTIFSRLIFVLLLFISLILNTANGQNGPEIALNIDSYVTFNNLKIRNKESVTGSTNASSAEILSVQPLTETEQELSLMLNSNWIWAEHTLSMIDNYSSFIFRTKISTKFSEVKLLLHVDSMGRIKSFEILSSSDKGLLERLDHVIRKLPSCTPVTGFDFYNSEIFELIVQK